MLLTPKSVNELICTIEARPPEGNFAAPRWPHTYAYDYLRAHTYDFDVPGVGTPSRTAVLAWLNENLDESSTKDEICELLARAYLRENHIVVTFCKFCDQPLVTAPDSTTWLTSDGNASCSSRDSVPTGRIHQAA